MQFRDRADAGRQLAAELKRFAGQHDLLVLGLPRGGVPVAAEVAAALHAPLDVFLSRKLGVPGQEELAFGAVTSGGGCFLDNRVIEALGLNPAAADAVTRTTRASLAPREQLFRGDRPSLPPAGRTLILVDDGVATGCSMIAAVRALRELHPRRIVVAVPVAPSESLRALKREADAVITVYVPERFFAVGQFYADFRQTTDEEVLALLKAHRPAIATCGAGGASLHTRQFGGHDIVQGDARMSTNPIPNPDPNTTIGELRQQLGPHFAKPHQNTDTLGMVLAHAGVSSLEEYLAKHPQTQA